MLVSKAMKFNFWSKTVDQLCSAKIPLLHSSYNDSKAIQKRRVPKTSHTLFTNSVSERRSGLCLLICCRCRSLTSLSTYLFFFCLSFPLSLFLIFLSLCLFHSLLSGSFCVVLPILNVQQLGDESALTKPWGKLALPV